MFFIRFRNFHPLCSSLVLCLSVHCSSQSDYLYVSSDPLVLRTLGGTLYVLHPLPQLPPLVFFTCPLSLSSLQFSKWLPLSFVRPLSSQNSWSNPLCSSSVPGTIKEQYLSSNYSVNSSFNYSVNPSFNYSVNSSFNYSVNSSFNSSVIAQIHTYAQIRTNPSILP